MATQRTIPVSRSTDLPTFTIIADGNPISGEHNIMSIVVSKSVNKIPYAQIIMLDGDPSSEDFPLSNEEFFIPGIEIEIEAGYHGSTETIFKGIVIKHGLKARKDKPPMLVIEAKDESVKMTIGRKNRYFEEVKDSEAIEEIIGEYELESDVESTSETHKEMVQYYSTDWDFIVSRAEKNGMLVMPDDGEVKIKKPSTESESSLMLVYGATVLEFEVEMDARNQFSAIKGKSWDYSNQEVVETDAEAPGRNPAGNLDEEVLAGVIDLNELELKHGGQVSEQELQAWADTAAVKSSLSKIRGRVRCQGFSEIKPGDTIDLEGVGDRFYGNMFVSGVAHQFADNQWTTDIHVGLSPDWFSQSEEIIDKKASGLLPGINGLQIGVVSDLEDPDGEDRVKVKLPIINPGEEGVWSRIALLDAGDSRSSYFLPEVDDEVIVGFLNDDPRDPIVLGMLHSSAKPAPITGSNDNHEKGFVTRSDMKLIFNDDEVSTTIETPNGNKIVLSDQEGSIVIEDENGNKIEMTSSGILMESASDMTIKAAGEITVESGTNMTLTAGAQFKAEGSAGAELSSGAIAVVSGSLVQIN